MCWCQASLQKNTVSDYWNSPRVLSHTPWKLKIQAWVRRGNSNAEDFLHPEAKPVSHSIQKDDRVCKGMHKWENAISVRKRLSHRRNTQKSTHDIYFSFKHYKECMCSIQYKNNYCKSLPDILCMVDPVALLRLVFFRLIVEVRDRSAPSGWPRFMLDFADIVLQTLISNVYLCLKTEIEWASKQMFQRSNYMQMKAVFAEICERKQQ